MHWSIKILRMWQEIRISSSLTGYNTKVKISSLSYNLPLAGKGIVGGILFLRELALYEKQIALL